MRILIDGLPDLVSADAASRLGDILVQITQWLHGQGRAVQVWTLDGEPLTVPRRDELSSSAVDRFGLLEVRTVDRFAAPIGTLQEARTLLADLTLRHVRVAELLQEGDRTPEALNALQSCLGDWNLMMQAVRSSADLSGVAAPADAASAATTLRAVLGEVVDACRGGDLLRLADLIEHDLRPMLAGWDARLLRQIESIREEGDRLRT